MYQVYLARYHENCTRRASLDLLRAALMGLTDGPPMLTEHGTHWTMLLPSDKAPFVYSLFRTVDRCFYHACKANELLCKDLKGVMFDESVLNTGGALYTGDSDSKYEIEAFLAAIKTLSAPHLIGVDGPGKQNLLGNSETVLGKALVDRLRQLLATFGTLIYEEKWLEIRNAAAHQNPELTDLGFSAMVERVGSALHVTLSNIYCIEEASIDLVEVFVRANAAFIEVVTGVRGLLTDFVFEHGGRPSHGRFKQTQSTLGNMITEFGPGGYTERAFPPE